MYFDIGANIGKWSLTNITKTDKIIAIEAINETFQKLKNNVGNNINIIPLNLAVCYSDCNEITFYKAINADTLSTLNQDWLNNPKSRFFGTSYVEEVCKTISIDNLIETYGEPELIKIDVEGGEFETIKSLTKKTNNLCFEWASETNDITLKCIDYLFNLGFNKFYVQFGDDYIFRPSNYYDINHTKNILSNSKPKIDWGMIWCK